MKIPAAALAFLVVCSAALRAEDPTREALVKEREAVLVKMEKVVTSQHAAGNATSDEVKRARLSLLKFRQENAGTPEERIAFQEKIIGTQTERLKDAESRYASGDGDQVEFLKAQDRVLRAKQRLLDMKAKN